MSEFPIKALLTGCVSFVLTACGSSSSPTEEDARSFIEKQTKSSGCIQLVDFKKLNGVAMEVMGAKAYQMEFQASYEVFSAPCYGEYDAKRKMFSEPPSVEPNKIRAFAKDKQLELAKGNKFEVGARKILFVKKENGWEVTSSGIMGIF
ncbi:MAG: hypothetical protein ACKOF9_03585 [Burkholderiales bacterium]